MAEKFEKWSHVADANLECRHLIALDPEEPGYARSIARVIRPVDAQKIVDDHNRLAALEAENAQLKAEVERLDWKPITPESLPCEEDEVASWHPGGRVAVLSAQWEMSYSTLIDYGYTHYRPINPPARAAQPKEQADAEAK